MNTCSRIKLAVEHDVIPLDGVEGFQRGEIGSIGDRVALAEDPGDFPRLPVDDARQDQIEAEPEARPPAAVLSLCDPEAFEHGDFGKVQD